MKKMRMMCAVAAVMLCGAVPAFAQVADTAAVEAPAADAVVAEAAELTADYALVKEIGADNIVVEPESAYDGPVQLNIGEASQLLDNETGKGVIPADLKVGDKIYAYWEPAMTRSIPPQSNLRLLLTNVDDSVPAHLHTVEYVEGDVSGDLVVTTNNGGLLLTIPAKMWEDMSGGALQSGDQVIAWYDIVATSYPGQATAERVAAVADDQPAVMPDAVIEPVVKQATLIEIFRGGDDFPHVVVETVDEQTVRLNIDLAALTTDTPIIDAQTGAVKTMADLKPGMEVVACYGPQMTMSIPAQSPMQYMLINLGEDAPVGMFTAEKVETAANGTRVLTNNGSLYISIPKDYAAPAEGEQFLAWYDLVLESYPGQTTADKIMLVDNDPDRPLTAVTVAGKVELADSVEYVGGVAMVPLRAVAEALGFEIEWNPANMSAKLSNGIVQTVVRTGLDSYYKATAIEGMVGMSAPQSYGAAMYLRNKETAYVPAQMFELLGASVVANGDTLLISMD